MKPCLQAVSCQPLRPYRANLLTILILTALPLTAQRDPVLKQIDLPHRYYYREMYLPQLTTGPNSAAWTSDSSSLVYSMSGRCGGRL
jgi:TolB protein